MELRNEESKECLKFSVMNAEVRDPTDRLRKIECSSIMSVAKAMERISVIPPVKTRINDAPKPKRRRTKVGLMVMTICFWSTGMTIV